VGLQRRAAQPPVFFAGLMAGFGFPRSSVNPELLEALRGTVFVAGLVAGFGFPRSSANTELLEALRATQCSSLAASELPLSDEHGGVSFHDLLGSLDLRQWMRAHRLFRRQ
jgi:hypothetical protein